MAQEPSPRELHLIGVVGRIYRLAAREGISTEEALERILRPETREEYLKRNEEAIAAIQEYLLSPGYLKSFSDAMGEADPVRSVLLAELKRITYASVDMEAVHRTISARNRQLTMEGFFPTDTSASRE